MQDSERIALLEKLVNEHHAHVRGYVFSRTGDSDVTEDLVQETFLIAFKRLDVYDQTRPAWLWLKGIARNQLRDHWRSVERTSAIERLCACLAEKKIEDDMKEDADDAVGQRLQSLKACMERLSEKSRTLLQLIYGEKNNCEEVARTWGATGTSVRVYLHRARVALRNCMLAQIRGS